MQMKVPLSGLDKKDHSFRSILLAGVCHVQNE